VESDRRRISDEELKELAKQAIAVGETKTGFYYELLSKNIAMDVNRLNRIWVDLGGPIQMRRGGWI